MDLTKCKGYDCPVKETCLRRTANIPTDPALEELFKE
jgi:hypothetical protein